MRTQSLYKTHFSHTSFAVSNAAESTDTGKENGLISELVYNEHQPAVAQLLLPLLQQLGMQSRWLLWLTPQQKLSKLWLQQSGLPIGKVVQLSQINPLDTVEAMEKALLTGNYSVVLGWLPDLTEEDRLKLRRAAELGNAYGFIMRPQRDINAIHGHCSTLKIHSSLYH
ncbi:SOS-induced cell division inhibitor SulA [Serratia quinivorans]|uniref:SOS-induced cell division inhibitor SulA n=1 Tax=Serratia quinivorans TaxID=137545 RepID=UPI00217874A1|nr:SOS-induced cell division inhibitor SulA [Serratia quinivorans]CAI0887278.1 Cell division inhibitor SulA [Serratia quinivorans]CAI0912852.1 Cell division inhibitor SulA [Serratia quinivorans]CAI1511812.1 Cell division inhibitor SulA [Serratia quinivorans]CAI2055951.1 Cell division inhibitor SulA [Serratia quinivorans]CAI2089948.1 Cell division inhibitor SulA [Serratia quinivorans]